MTRGYDVVAYLVAVHERTANVLTPEHDGERASIEGTCRRKRV